MPAVQKLMFIGAVERTTQLDFVEAEAIAQFVSGASQALKFFFLLGIE